MYVTGKLKCCLVVYTLCDRYDVMIPRDDDFIVPSNLIYGVRSSKSMVVSKKVIYSRPTIYITGPSGLQSAKSQRLSSAGSG